MWVVKLGGSLWDAGELRHWLASLAMARPTACLVVPGGGPFADAVRRAQPVMGFSELTAHRMAILAMEQYGLALLDLAPRLRAVRRASDAAALARERAAGVWLPAAMAMFEPELTASWDVSSDSIALWLATRLKAEALVLVKSSDVPDGSVAAADLARLGLVDRSFTSYAGGFAGIIRLVSRSSYGLVEREDGRLAGATLLRERLG